MLRQQEQGKEKEEIRLSLDVSKYKARYEAKLEVLERLMQIRDEELDKELLSAFRQSGLSHQDVVFF